MNFKTSHYIFVLLGVLLFSSCGKTKQGNTAQNKNEKLIAQANISIKEDKIPTISEMVATDVGFTGLHTLFQATDFGNMLNNEGPYTIFAPQNGALDRLPPKMLQQLKQPENKERLTSVLKYHIIPGVISKEDIVKAIQEYGGSVTLKTLGGNRLIAAMKKDKIYLIDETGSAGRVMVNDIEVANGIMHTVESVMIPK